jgi:hypothetical protein
MNANRNWDSREGVAAECLGHFARHCTTGSRCTLKGGHQTAVPILEGVSRIGMPLYRYLSRNKCVARHRVDTLKGGHQTAVRILEGVSRIGLPLYRYVSTNKCVARHRTDTLKGGHQTKASQLDRRSRKCQPLFGVHPSGCPFPPSNRRNVPAVFGSSVPFWVPAA